MAVFFISFSARPMASFRNIRLRAKEIHSKTCQRSPLMGEFCAAVEPIMTVQVYNHDIYPVGEEDLERKVALGHLQETRAGQGVESSALDSQTSFRESLAGEINHSLDRVTEDVDDFCRWHPLDGVGVL